jgi:hypothetical protein
MHIYNSKFASYCTAVLRVGTACPVDRFRRPEQVLRQLLVAGLQQLASLLACMLPASKLAAVFLRVSEQLRVQNMLRVFSDSECALVLTAA